MTTTTTETEKATDKPRFSYGIATVADLQVDRVQPTEAGKVSLKDLRIDGQPVVATRRFWRSFFSRFGIAENVFRYFTPAEVFNRIEEVNADTAFRFCIANHTDTDGRTKRDLLAVTSPKKPVIRHDEVVDLITRYGGSDVRYHNGLVLSTHAPRGGSRQFAIGGDQFRDRFCLETPIDGYGHPRLFLSMMRMVCSNGMIGYARAFRSDVPVGKHMDHCISRAIESFDNGDGYVALRQRFESSQSSWASVHECLTLATTLEKAKREKQLLCEGVLGRLRGIAGNLSELYGLSNIEALSDKRQRILPSKARVYDLINFASEIATHHATPDGANRIQAYIGTLVSDEYDLEGTAEKSADFDDFFIEDSEAVVRQSVN
ncbi:DUF932 domain-containing protein [Rubripirellula reticaptiva]|uniref:DUF932 domain-containing protein n=1 Tax=Rubripirellula reticaptiva TaxID=2528013 RepID=A0A5C6F9E2_9BACT|nr:DUF932 domain-containing protein [Rubripirellula reticaptiva]TWU57998.1 hypothetical protein Poly59_09070 [Rubripirellula reticaptiva]